LLKLLTESYLIEFFLIFRMLNKFLKDVIIIVVGKQVEDIADLLNAKKHVNEFIIAKKLDLTINQTRNILYKISDHGLVSSIRKKDKRKGWYTYFWKIEILKALEFLKEILIKKKLQILNQIKSRETKQFYVCERCNIEFNEENALLHNFTCDECGGIFSLKDNSKVLKEFKRHLEKINRELSLVNSEIEKELLKIEKQRQKQLAKQKREKAKKTKASIAKRRKTAALKAKAKGKGVKKKVKKPIKKTKKKKFVKKKSRVVKKKKLVKKIKKKKIVKKKLKKKLKKKPGKKKKIMKEKFAKKKLKVVKKPFKKIKKARKK